MYAPKTVSSTFAQPAAAVLDAVKRLADQKPYSSTGTDEAQGVVAFKQGKTALSWGTEYEVRVAEASSGSEVKVTAGGVDGAPKALLDGMKHSKAAKKFLGELTRTLGA